MTQLQLEYQKYLEDKRLHDAQISKLGVETRKVELEHQKVVYEAQEALAKALNLNWQSALTEMQITALPYQTTADMMKGIGSVAGGTGKLIKAL